MRNVFLAIVAIGLLSFPEFASGQTWKSKSGGSWKKSQNAGSQRLKSNFNLAKLPSATSKSKPATKPKLTKDVEAEAKKKYAEIFASKDAYEVRLRNKSLAMKKGWLMGMANGNSLAVFESKRMVVAVPADSLNKKLAAKVAERIDEAKAYFKETGIAYDHVMDVPKTGDEKQVGLANREKITMFVHRKPRPEKKKKARKSESEADKASDSKIAKAKS